MKTRSLLLLCLQYPLLARISPAATQAAPASTLDSSFDAFDVEASRLKQLRDWPSLESLCMARLGMHPDDIPALMDLGEARDMLGNSEASIDAFQHVLRLDPRHAQALYALGVVYSHANRADKVLECHASLQEIDPVLAYRFWDLYAKEASKNQRAYAKLGFNPPKVVFRPPTPLYPEGARAAGVQGTVVVQLLIGTDGRVVSTRATAGPDELRSAAEQYALQWVFEPCIKDGKPSEAKFILNLPFKLR